jgi:folate-binding protein YgfZ
MEEYRALTSGAGVIDLGSRTQVELTGRDRVAFLNGFCTNDIKRLTPGEGCEAFLTNVKGKIVGYVYVFCQADSLVLDTVPDQGPALIAHLERYCIREDVRFQDRSESWGELLVAGRRAESLLSQCVASLPPARPLAHLPLEAAGIPLSLRRVPLVPDGGFLVSLPAGAVSDVWRQLTAAGAKPGSREVFEMLRLEAAAPWFGRDITPENLPQEVQRDALAISFRKGCYLGQETVARLDALGHVNRRLVALRWDRQADPQTGDALSWEGSDVGRVTSTAFSPRRDAPRGLGYVKSGHDQPGTRLDSPAGPAEVEAPGA